MSKIGKKPIELPSGVTVEVHDATLTAKGAKGTLTRTLPAGVKVAVEGSRVIVSPASEAPSREERAQWGLWRALVSNMLTGVSAGWQTALEFQGVGYKAVLKGKDLELSLGYSHPITVHAPDGITFTTEKTSIVVHGIDKELVGHVASIIRSKRLPEPYKGSGIRYADEVIKKKAGKKAATAGA
jgi:large subunit ribosomal protein L6